MILMLWWLLQNTVVAGMLAAAVWLTCRARRLSPTVRHALWLVVLVKLITPPLIVWPWQLPARFEFPPMARSSSEFDIATTPSRNSPSLQWTSNEFGSTADVDPGLQEFARRLEEIDQGNSGIVDVLVPRIESGKPGEFMLIPDYAGMPGGRSTNPASERSIAWLANALWTIMSFVPWLGCSGFF